MSSLSILHHNFRAPNKKCLFSNVTSQGKTCPQCGIAYSKFITKTLGGYVKYVQSYPLRHKNDVKWRHFFGNCEHTELALNTVYWLWCWYLRFKICMALVKLIVQGQDIFRRTCKWPFSKGYWFVTFFRRQYWMTTNSKCFLIL